MGNKSKKKAREARVANSLINFSRVLSTKKVATKLFADRPIWVWSAKGDSVLWANEEGCRFFKTKSFPELLSRKFRGISPAISSIQRVGRKGNLGESYKQELKFLLGMQPVLINANLTRLNVTGIGDCVLVEARKWENREEPRKQSKMRTRYVKLFSRGDEGVAFLTSGGKVEEASDAFRAFDTSSKLLKRIAKSDLLSRDRAAVVLANDHVYGFGLIENADEEGGVFVTASPLNRLSDQERKELALIALDSSAFDTKTTGDENTDTEEYDSNGSGVSSSIDDHSIEPTDTVNSTIEEDNVVTDPLGKVAASALPIIPDEEVNPPQTPLSATTDIANTPSEQRASVRFLFELSKDGTLQSVSPEFPATVGSATGDITGESLFSLIEQYNLDEDRKIERLFSSQAIWTREVWWPFGNGGEVGNSQNPPLRAPISLTAMPVFDRERQFEGYRGFGVIKKEDAVARPDLELQIAQLADDADDDNEPEDNEAEWETFLATTPLDSDSSDDDDDQLDAEAYQIDIDDLVSQSSNVVEIQPEVRPDRETPDNIVPLHARNIGEKDADGDKKIRLSGSEKKAFEKIAEALSAPANADRQKTKETDAEASFDLSAANVVEGLTGIGRSTQSKKNRGDFTTQNAGNDEPESDQATVSDEQQPSSLISNQHRDASEIEDSILDRLPLGLIVSRNRSLLFVNRAILEFLGYENLETFEEAGGLSSLFEADKNAETDLLQNTDVFSNLVAEATKAGPNTITAVIKRVQRANGESAPVDIRMQSGRWKDDEALLMTLSDVSDTNYLQMSQDERVSQLVGQSTGVMDIASDGILLLDREGQLLHANASAEALFGYDRREMRTMQLSKLFSEESKTALEDYLDGLTANGIASVLSDGREVTGKSNTGETVPLFITIGKIDERAEKQDEMYCAVLRDITQWKAVEEELTKSQKAAEAANAQKSEFLAKVSHEIRTPLNAIIGFSEVMMGEHLGPIENRRYHEYAHDIHKSGTHLVSIVNDLLDLSKIEAGKADLSFDSVTLNGIIQECVSIMQPDANRERIVIRTSLLDELPPVVADSRSIRQITLNLLSNAIKFTDSGGQVIVSTTLEDNGEVTIRVRDTGIGMTDKDLEVALQPFRQVSATAQGKQIGTGLGLPLTKALVEANRARFSIDSRVDFGTLIQVIFPNERVLAQ